MIEKIGQILLGHNAITQAALEDALIKAQVAHLRLGEYLREACNYSESSIFKALAEQFNMELITDIAATVDREFIHESTLPSIKTCRAVPLTGSGDILRLALVDPLDFEAVMGVEAATGRVTEAILTLPSQAALLQSQIGSSESVLTQTAAGISREYQQQTPQSEDDLSAEELRKRTESEPIVKLAGLILQEAFAARASDIHIEPAQGGAVVRLRIDGLLQQHMTLTRAMYLPLTSRLKIMADLDIAEKRAPQDGRIRYAWQGQQYDFRVSTLPMLHGEKIVIRILKHDVQLLDLSNLEMPVRQFTTLTEMLEKPQGMIFVTGPTGSGKSSTLFAALNRIRHKAINITTIENPIEYKLEGINQVQINEKAGVTFATTLRSILRQDPDVILIGEIRDRETAEIALQASQTGHLVLSTLHTNDAVSAITRLKDLGVAPFLIASSLLGIVAQRLVRRLCCSCRQPAAADDEILARWQRLLGNLPLPPSYRAVGCDHCKGSGYLGRCAVFEVVSVAETLRDLISVNAAEAEIRRHLQSVNHAGLIQAGVQKIKEGITTPAELLRVVMVEESRISNNPNQ